MHVLAHYKGIVPRCAKQNSHQVGQFIIIQCAYDSSHYEDDVPQLAKHNTHQANQGVNI